MFPDNFKDSVSAGVTLPDSFGNCHFLICVDEGQLEIESELEESGFEQDPDVLDTWFSSALWPHATLGWPDTEHDPPLDEAVIESQSSHRGVNTPRSPSDVPRSPTTHHSPLTTHKNEVLNYFYPGSVLITSRDIITLWVARMVLTGLYNPGRRSVPGTSAFIRRFSTASGRRCPSPKGTASIRWT